MEDPKLELEPTDLEEAPELETQETPEAEVVETPEPEATPALDYSRYEAEREARHQAELKLARIEGIEKPAPVTNQDPMPDPKDYEGREIEFSRDLMRWDARKTSREEFTRLQTEATQKSRESEAGAQIQKARDNYKTQVDAEIASDPTLFKAIQATANVPLTDGRDFFVANSPFAGKIAKFLAKTPGELVKYAGLPLDEALKYIGRLEGKFESAPTGAAPQISKAPAPHKALEGPAGGATAAYKAGDGPEAYLRTFYPEMYS